MYADDVKPWIDMLVALMAPASLGGIVLAAFGIWRAKVEKPAHIADPPGVGSSGMAALGGMVMGRQLGDDIVAGLNALAASQDRCTLVREQEIRLAREISETRHREMRTLNDHLDTLNDRIKNMPGCGA